MSTFTRTHEHHQRRGMILVGGIGLLLSLGLIVGLYRYLDRFRIQEVGCFVGLEPCDAAFVQRAQQIKGKYLWTNIRRVTGDDRVVVKRQWPATILLQFPQREILAVVVSADRQKKVLVYDDGSVTHQQKDGTTGIEVIDEPVVLLEEGAIVDEWRRSFFQEVRSLLVMFPYPDLRSIRVVSRSEIWWYIGDMVVGTRSDGVASQLRSLQYVFQTPTIDVHGKQVDLRFDQPVIRDIE